MIRFWKKMVHNIREEELNIDEIYDYYLRDEAHIPAVFAIHDASDRFRGIITYSTLIYGKENDCSCINNARICISEKFWEEAKEFFDEHPRDLLTIVNGMDEIVGWIYNDRAYYGDVESALSSMEKWGIPALTMPKYRKIKMVVITDLNELAWRCCKVFKNAGYQVCVIGKKWEWFGYKSSEGYIDYEEDEKLYIYAEGNAFLRQRGSVREAFLGVTDLALECAKIVYEAEMKRLVEKGVSVYECVAPERDEVGYKTELEYRAYDMGRELTRLIRGMSPSAIKCMEEIYGKETIDTLCVNNAERLLKDTVGVCGGRFREKVVDYNFFRPRIYIAGACTTGGYRCLPEDTLIAQLQQLVNADGYLVVGFEYTYCDYDMLYDFRKIPFRRGDVLIILYSTTCFPENVVACERMDMCYIWDNPMRETLFSDQPLHSNAEGNCVMAKEIYENLLKDEIEKWRGCEREFLQKGEILSDEMITEISSYAERVKVDVEGTVGAIVMNCNPFTLGHRYLIEYAASRVDNLYVFVVEEDRSLFLFEDRIQMVKQGVEDLPNVFVVPSGKWVLSYETMPIYFEKATKQEATVDASKDLEIFARYIAKPLGVTKRFVGEEPTDNVTRQYNEQMQELLGLFEIELEVVPRKEMDGMVISASTVRRYMQDGDWDLIRRMVPETTYKVCKKYGQNMGK